MILIGAWTKGGRTCSQAYASPPSIHVHINAMAQLMHEHCLPNCILHRKTQHERQQYGAILLSELTSAMIHPVQLTGSLARRGEITTVLTLLLSERADLQCKAECTWKFDHENLLPVTTAATAQQPDCTTGEGAHGL